MKTLLTILILLYSQFLIGQIKIGNYSKNDTSTYVTLKLFADSSYDFYYIKGHCSNWGHYLGKWQQNGKTLILNYCNEWSEEIDSIVTEPNLNEDSVYITFKYDDKSPIKNVPVNISCDFSKYTKTYFSDSNGKVVIPYNGEFVDFYNKKCSLLESFIHFNIETEFVKLYTVSSELNFYVRSPFSSKFTVIIKKNLKSYKEIISKKFKIRNNKLFEIKAKYSNPHFIVKTWGDFKFVE